MSENPNPNVKFLWVTVDSILDPWNPSLGERGIKIHYVLWLSKAYRAARELCKQIDFDIAHHISWGTLGAAPQLWQLPVPSVWGPVGGGQCTPPRFLRYFGWGAWQEILRSCYVRALRFSPGLRKTARHSRILLATNRETEKLLKKVAGEKVHRFLDCGLAADWVPAVLPVDRTSNEFTLLWAGRLEHRKALALGLEALAQVRRIRVRLLVAGTGVLRPTLEVLATKLGLDSRVQFLGSVPHDKMPALLQSADAFLFTSVRDSFGSVVLEAMAQGLPIVSLNHQGVGTFVPDEAGIKVPVTTPRQTVRTLAVAIETLGTSPSLRRKMQLASWNFAKTQTWDQRAKRMSRLYAQAVSTHTQPVRPIRKTSACTE
jgi:glycosyltransferase involved in cell wall biosynthesis